jgi:hypothetical protein
MYRGYVSKIFRDAFAADHEDVVHIHACGPVDLVNPLFDDVEGVNDYCEGNCHLRRN